MQISYKNMSKPVIRINHVWKKYRIGQVLPYFTLRDIAMGIISQPFEIFRHKESNEAGIYDNEFWAIKDVSLDINEGEVVGIVGRNGAGKSTLLKILSRITPPTKGEIVLNGRVASLLEVGTGFQQELTGRENIYLNGAILGMRQKEIKRKFDEIVEFAEIRKFLDTPVKHFSTGMYMRLAFSIAAHLDPDVLIVDEVLAVGDVAFQKKCLGKIESVAKTGRTVLFVSHNMWAVSSLCHKVALMENGSIIAFGKTDDVLEKYHREMDEVLKENKAEIEYNKSDKKSAYINKIRIADNNGLYTLQHKMSAAMNLTVNYVVNEDFKDLLLWCEVRTSDGTLVFTSTEADWENAKSAKMRNNFTKKQGEYEVKFEFPANFLNEGKYEIELFLTSWPLKVDTRREIMFEVADDGGFSSFITKKKRGGIVCPPIRSSVKLL